MNYKDLINVPIKTECKEVLNAALKLFPNELKPDDEKVLKKVKEFLDNWFNQIKENAFDYQAYPSILAAIHEYRRNNILFKLSAVNIDLEFGLIRRKYIEKIAADHEEEIRKIAFFLLEEKLHHSPQ